VAGVMMLASSRVCCSVLQCVAVCCGGGSHYACLVCSVLPCVAVWCSVLQCVTVCCSVLQCVAACCSACSCGSHDACLVCSVLQCVAAWCSVLQCVALTGVTVLALSTLISRTDTARRQDTATDVSDMGFTRTGTLHISPYMYVHV